MENPGRLPLNGDRWTAFVRTLTFTGIDLTGATFAMQVRLKPDTPGAPLVDLATVTSASAEGVRLISVTGTGADVVSLVGIRINETTMESLPAADEVGNDTPLAWDMHITPASGIKEKYLYGPFNVRGGVTQ